MVAELIKSLAVNIPSVVMIFERQSFPRKGAIISGMLYVNFTSRK